MKKVFFLFMISAVIFAMCSCTSSVLKEVSSGTTEKNDSETNGISTEKNNVEANGMCGEDVKWVLDTSGLLTISGTGDMTRIIDADYESSNVLGIQYADLITACVIENGVTSICQDAFYGCTALARVEIPDSITSIGQSAFGGCSSLASITIPDSVTSIGNSAFWACASLTDIVIPGSVNELGYAVFSGCSNLVSATLSDGLLSTGDRTFSDCSVLSHIIFPDGLKSIGHETFLRCTGLTEIVIPDGVTEIGVYAFSDCENLSDITIPDSVVSIGILAFNNTAYYNDDANLDNGILYTGDCLIYVKEVQSGACIVKPGTKTIADQGFWLCNELTDITIPDSVTSIGVCAVHYPGPKSVTYEGTEAQWKQVHVSEGNNPLLAAGIICTDGVIEPVSTEAVGDI